MLADVSGRMNNTPPLPLLLSIKEACRQLGDVSRPFVYRLLREKRLKGKKIGRRRLIIASSVREVAAEAERGE
jgi:excisionase family DNA binding protein